MCVPPPKLSASIAAFVLIPVVAFSPTALSAQEHICENHPPSVSLHVGTPNDDGLTEFTATFTFAHPPYDSSQRVEIFVNGAVVDGWWAAPQSGTWSGVINLACSI